jgi:hypothetical protein
MQPHMHLRGKDMRIEARYPDGEQQDAAERAALRLQLADRLLPADADAPSRRAPSCS